MCKPACTVSPRDCLRVRTLLCLLGYRARHVLYLLCSYTREYPHGFYLIEHELECIGGLHPNCLAVLADRAVVPVLYGCAYQNIAVRPLYDAVIDYMPSPVECEPLRVTVPEAGKKETRELSPDAPFTAYVFKTVKIS